MANGVDDRSQEMCWAPGLLPGIHSSTFQIDVSTFSTMRPRVVASGVRG